MVGRDAFWFLTLWSYTTDNVSSVVGLPQRLSLRKNDPPHEYGCGLSTPKGLLMTDALHVTQPLSCGHNRIRPQGGHFDAVNGRYTRKRITSQP